MADRPVLEALFVEPVDQAYDGGEGEGAEEAPRKEAIHGTPPARSSRG